MQTLRGDKGERLLLENNFFVEKVFTGGVMRKMDEASSMAAQDIPKLFIRSWLSQTEAVVKGLHHPQEDSPDEIRVALRNWLQEIG